MAKFKRNKLPSLSTIWPKFKICIFQPKADSHCCTSVLLEQTNAFAGYSNSQNTNMKNIDEDNVVVAIR